MPDQITKARLGPVSGTSNDDLIFELNPERVRRTVAERYADSPVAGADYASDYQGPAPFQWIANRPEEIRIEFWLIPRFLIRKDANRALTTALQIDDVMEEMAKIDGWRKRDRSTGEPPDLVFTMGPRSDRVRIFEREYDEKLYTPDLRVQQCQVSLTMRAVKFRTR